MRFLSLVIIMLLAMPIPVAMAGLGPVAWQEQLQGELDELLKTTPQMSVTSDVVVILADNEEMRAMFPKILFTADDKSQWVIPNITITTSPAAKYSIYEPIRIQLPSVITHISADNRLIGRINLGTQAIKGYWNYVEKSIFELTGTIKDVEFTDMLNGMKTGASYLAIQFEDAKEIKVVATTVSGTKNETIGTTRSYAGNLTLNYTLPQKKPLTFERIFSLLNPAFLLSEGEKLTVDMIANNVRHQSPNGQISAVEKLVSKMQIQPSKERETFSTRNDIEISRMSQQPQSFLNPFLPIMGKITGTISNAPLEMISLTPGQGFSALQEAMVKSGARTDIDEIVIDTESDAMFRGRGWLKAAENVPTGFVGRLDLVLENPEALSASLQKQMRGNGVQENLKTQGQSLMLLMMLQGMGKQNPKKGIEFVIDLTPDGQLLVNGQNVTSLLPAPTTRVRSIPLAPEAAPLAGNVKQ